jgi:hypothetical protein
VLPAPTVWGDLGTAVQVAAPLGGAGARTGARQATPAAQVETALAAREGRRPLAVVEHSGGTPDVCPKPQAQACY